jgi:hypothetical protein
VNRWLRFGARTISEPRFFVRRLQNEARAPSTGFGRAARALYTSVVPNRPLLSHANEDRLLFVYDTLPNPVTYDFIHYLFHAEWLRREHGKAHLDVLLVVRENVAASREAHYVAAIGAGNLEWRLANILLPLCRLFPSLGRVYIVEQEEAFDLVERYEHVHPQGYGYARPITATCRLDVPGFVFRPTLKVPPPASAIVEAYFPPADPRKLVTITLRTYAYLTKRNSNIPAWAEFARGLDHARYRPVFIPDASVNGVAALPDLRGCEVFDSACWNLELRAALYRRAWMNVGVVGGPMTISCLMEDPITAMIFDPSSFPADYLAEYARNTGLAPGAPPTFYSPRCKFHHGADDLGTIQKVFREYAD